MHMHKGGLGVPHRNIGYICTKGDLESPTRNIGYICTKGDLESPTGISRYNG